MTTAGPRIARGRAAVRPVPRSRAGRWLNMLQAAVTIVVAAVVAASAVLSSRADGAWNEASRQETTWSAGLIEDSRHVYGDEAPLALTVAVSEARARALRQAAKADLVSWEATAEAQTAGNLRQAHTGSGGLLDGDRYRLPGGGLDVARRLADIRAAEPTLRDLDPAGRWPRGTPPCGRRGRSPPRRSRS